MSALVTIFKEEFIDKVQVLKSIDTLSDQIELVENAYIVKPSPGKLFEILNKLKDNRIAYRTYFNTSGKAST